MDSEGRDAERMRCWKILRVLEHVYGRVRDPHGLAFEIAIRQRWLPSRSSVLKLIQ